MPRKKWPPLEITCEYTGQYKTMDELIEGEWVHLQKFARALTVGWIPGTAIRIKDATPEQLEAAGISQEEARRMTA